MKDRDETQADSNVDGQVSDASLSLSQEKMKRLDHERTILLSHLKEFKLEDVKTKVGYILNQYPATRNSDVTLIIKYWEVFHPELLENGAVSFESLYILPKFNSISRARAKIQNEYRLYQASEVVKERRAELNSEQRKSQIEDKPKESVVSIFCDESGKSQKYNLVGSLWINDSYRMFKVFKELSKWKSDENVTKELHFTNLSERDAKIAEEFIEKVLGQSDALGFKAVILDSSTVKSMSPEDRNFRLHYQLVVQGIEHEVQTRRFDLPRNISLTKDKDDGSDKLRLVELEQKLRTDCQAYFHQKITIDEVKAEESHSSIFIQLTDIFTGSINRKLNSPGLNYKDKLAERVLDLLGIKDVHKTQDELHDFATILWIGAN